MRYSNFSIQFFLLAMLFMQTARGVDLLIDQSGFYKLGDTILSLPLAADSIINITVGNVVLDLGGLTTSQGNATALVDGVSINSGLSDVVVQNGTISNVTRSGIRVGSSCSKIIIQNIEFLNCATAGADFQGTASAAIVDGAINNCQFYNCGTTAGGAPLNLLGCSNFSVNNCTIANSSATITWTGALLSTCSQCTIQSVMVKGNTSTNSLTGIGISGGASNSFSNCFIQNNIASSLTGFNLAGSTTSTILLNSFVSSNSSLTGILVGYNFNNAAFSYVDKCTANSNTSVGGMQGFLFDTSAVNSVVSNCIVNANSTTSLVNSFTGFAMLVGSSGLLRDCSALYNSSATRSHGMVINATGNAWVVTSPFFTQNSGSSGANSFGLLYSASAPLGTLFLRTLAFANNTTGNQISFPAAYSGSLTTIAAATILNSVTGVWTNLAVPS
ncbi:right-handed parallel beta-helix repeat-containing protein [Candidatus Dependentiae bacterium]|nr:right-handed parallel beta-helix repeat-containing protein [Candidatus Dependentiae bacterium]